VIIALYIVNITSILIIKNFRKILNFKKNFKNTKNFLIFTKLFFVFSDFLFNRKYYSQKNFRKNSLLKFIF